MKTRISKEPEIRKNEIIEAAEELFLNQGFEETTVSDIVNKVGVAQGLFYYYFKSKDEILDAVVERFTENVIAELNLVGGDDQLNAIQKLQTIFTAIFSVFSQKEKLVIYMHEERNELLHYRLAYKFMDKVISLFLKIIEQGIREKVFDVEYPRETTEILLTGMSYMPSIFKSSLDSEHFAMKFHACLAVTEKTLGAPKGSLQIKDLR